MSGCFPGFILALLTVLISGCGSPATQVEEVRDREAAARGDRAAERALLSEYKALGRRDLAERWLETLRGEDPADPDLWREQIRLLRESGRLVAALASADALLAQRPDDVDLVYDRGEVLAELQKTDEALLVFQGLQEEHPLEWRAYVAEAALRMERLQGDDLARAEERLSRCPEHPEAATLVLFHQALAAELAGRLEEAVHLHGAVLAQEPGYVPSHRNLALLRMREGRVGEAIQHLESARELTPGTEVALRRLLDDRLQEWRAVRDAADKDDDRDQSKDP